MPSIKTAPEATILDQSKCAALPETLLEAELSAMRKGRSLGRYVRGVGGLSWPIEVRCFSMKSGKSRGHPGEVIAGAPGAAV